MLLLCQYNPHISEVQKAWKEINICEAICVIYTCVMYAYVMAIMEEPWEKPGCNHYTIQSENSMNSWESNIIYKASLEQDGVYHLFWLGWKTVMKNQIPSRK